MALIRVNGGNAKPEALEPGKFLVKTTGEASLGNIVTGSASYTSVANVQGAVVFNTNRQYSTLTVNQLSAPVIGFLHHDGTVTAATNTTTDISDVDFVIASWGATSTTSSFTFA